MRYFVVDAFAEQPFSGNPAGVCLLEDWPDDTVLQQIAEENHLSATAFIRPRSDTGYDLRWFSPACEVDLCGHATLGSAFVLMNCINTSLGEVIFQTRSGPVLVARQGDLFEMDMPARPAHPVEIEPLMTEAIGVRVLEAHSNVRDLLLLVDSEKLVQSLRPKFRLVAALPDCLGVIVTARGESCDFVSRFFVPNAGVDEDPVTGSSHSMLVPFWAERLGKNEMTARQLSARGGRLYCSLAGGDRVKIAGKARLYLEGTIHP